MCPLWDLGVHVTGADGLLWTLTGHRLRAGRDSGNRWEGSRISQEERSLGAEGQERGATGSSQTPEHTPGPPRRMRSCGASGVGWPWPAEQVTSTALTVLLSPGAMRSPLPHSWPRARERQRCELGSAWLQISGPRCRRVQLAGGLGMARTTAGS